MNIDLDEILPDRFIINNDKVRPLLRGEGVTVGKFFDLVTWRRDGLIARIRSRGFNVRTIADRIGKLPNLPQVAPPGAETVRPLSVAKERFATFDPATLHWHDLPTIDQDGTAAVLLPVDVAVRRRKSRGSGDYFITSSARNGALNISAVTETDALLHAYAQIARSDRPAVLRFNRHDDLYHVASDQATLPPPHRIALDLLARSDAPPWTFDQKATPLVEDVLTKVGVQLQAT